MPKRAHAPSRINRLRHQLGLGVVLLMGLALSLGLYRFANYTEQQRIQEEFYRRATVRHALISESIHGYEECLYSLRNLFTSSDDVTMTEFAATARDILTRHQGIQALQWVPVITDDKRTQLETWARTEIIPGYTITERTPDGRLVPAARRPLHYPILYTYPVAGNEPALGYDLTVGPSRNDLDRSVKTGTVVLTRKFRLIQEEPGINRYGVVMSCPVFLETTAGKQLNGFVQIVFKINDMLDQSWIVYPANALDAVIVDATQPPDSDPFIYGRRAQESTLPVPESISDIAMEEGHKSSLQIGGRVWDCYYAPTAGWKSAQGSGLPRLVLCGSLILTLVVGSYFISVRRRAGLIREQVNERTAELRHTQGLLEADIAKRQSTEAELRESRRQLDSIFGQMPGMAYRYINKTPKIATLISRGSVEIIGFTPSEITSGRICYDERILPEDRPANKQAVDDAIARRTAYESEYRIRDHEQAVKWVLDRGQGIYSSEGELLFIEGLVIDITRRKQAEADKAALDRKLLESQKLESLGVLAGGIAHDFNNLLTTITGHASITRMDLPAHSPLQEHLVQIEAGAKRAAELCQQMLAYAGKGRFLVQRTSLEKLVRDTTSLLSHSISKRARLAFDFQTNAPDIDADATQIRQIIMNLVVNASDAIGERDGIITIQTGTIHRDDPRLTHAALPPPPCDGVFASLTIRDTGDGMEQETINKIFDPFFTTKFAGRGLGLAAVLGIVRSHNGSLLVESTPGVGSTFTLLLPPSVSKPVPTTSGSRPPIETRAHPLAGTVLLIDDEDGVRSVADQMFHSLGLKTLTAADGVEGLALFKQHQTDIALVLLDLTMPRMSGEETLTHLRALAPQLPVILMSGYNQSAVSGFASDPKLSFLQKPFSLQVLRRQISRILE